MLHKQMAERCPSSRFIGRAYIENFKFVYDGRSSSRKSAVANILPLLDEVVWGALYEINEDNLATLDCHEGYPTSYGRIKAEVINDGGQNFEAIVYLRDGLKIGIPSTEYRKIVKDGANDCGLPQDYVSLKL